PPVPRLLVFASPGCLSCRELIPGLNEVRTTRNGEFDFLVICRGDIESCRSFGRMNRLEAPMVIDTDGQIEKDYMVTLTPFAYLLDHEGRVVIRGVANDWRQLESLLDQEGTLQAGRGWVDAEGNGDGSVVAGGSTRMVRTARVGGLVALTGAFGLVAAMLAGDANPSVGVPSVSVLVAAG